MTHNPAAAHPRLMALLDGMEQIEQAATQQWEYEQDTEGSTMGWIVDASGRPIFDVCGDSGLQYCNAETAALSRNALPPLLADLRRRAEAHERSYRGYREQEARAMHGSDAEAGARGRQRYHASHHHACCTTALAAAAGTPALAVLAGELQGAME